MAKIELEMRLMHWAAWCYLFEKNEQGWPSESMAYKFYREGITAEKNKVRKSQEPYRNNIKAEEINTLYNQLKQDDYKKAEALYLYYVHRVNIKKYAQAAKIVPRTFYKRLDAARKWIGERLPN